MARMFNPPHPGSILREDVLPAMGLSVTEAAMQLKVARATLSRVLNERAAISAEMAIRLSEWLGGDAGTWLRMQCEYDLWAAKKQHRIKIKKAVASIPEAEDDRFALAA
jgi:antitoxin HigA-1